MTAHTVPNSRTRIAPVGAGPRPLWSVMIPTYNRAEYLAQSIESVLVQDQGEEQMQIEVVDDCSSEDIRSVVEEVGKGRVGFFQQPTNVGSTRNFATCIQRSRGELVHILHGDDAIRPGFYDAMRPAFDAHPELGMAFSAFIVMTSTGRWEAIPPLFEENRGILDDALARVAVQDPQSGGWVVRRSVWEHLGGYDERVKYSEDWEMLCRIAAHYPIWYDPEPYVLYRAHEASISGAGVATGSNAADNRRVIEMIRTYLPPERADEITARASELAAIQALRQGLYAMGRGETAAWRRQNIEAFRTARSRAVIAHAAYLGLRGLRALRQYKKRQRAAASKTPS